MTQAKVAVVGLGSISTEHFAKLARIDGAEVAGICDLSETLVAAVAERFGVGPGYTSFDRMLEEVEPDAVHVLTPPQSHAELVRAALNSGAHVLVEKPIAPSWDDYAGLREAARTSGRMLVENYNYRFLSVVRRTAELEHAGAVGEVVSLDVDLGIGLPASGPYSDPDMPHFAHALPGGALRNNATHPVSIAVSLLGPHRSVRVAQARIDPGFASTDELRALAVHERGAARITISGRVRPGGLRLALYGTEGTVEADVFDERLHLDSTASPFARVTNPLRKGAGQLAATARLVAGALTSSRDMYEGFELLLREFYAAVAGEGPPPVSFEEMDAVNALVEALFAEENQL